MKKKKGLKIFIVILLIALVPTGYFVYKRVTKLLEYEIKYYYLDDATNSSKNPKKFTSKDGEIVLSEPRRAGYEFEGWFLDEDFETPITSFDASESKGISIYAKWSPNLYTISYDANGGTCFAPDEIVVYDSPYGELPTATREGYKFDGWHTSATEDSKVESTSNVRTSEDHTLYAHWKGITYYVSYDSNGGEGSMAKSKFTYGTSAKLSAVKFTKEGYVLKNWNTKKDGSGTAYEDCASILNMTIQDEKTFTLYAQWKLKTLIVTFDPNGGTVEQRTKEILYSSVYASLPTATRAGYAFVGWTLDKSTDVCVKATASVTTDHTLFAVWSPNSYHATLDHQTGTSSTTNVFYKFSESTYYADGSFSSFQQITSVAVPKKKGYDFDGYYTAPNGNGTKCINADGTIANNLCGIAKNSTLYAKWTYSIVFTNPNGSGSMSSQTFVYGVPQKIKKNTLTKDGYYFDGWQLNAAKSVTFEDCQEVSDSDFEAGDFSASKRFVSPIWENGPITLILDSYYSDGTSRTLYYIYYTGDRLCRDALCEDDAVVLGTPIYEDGYTYGGWETSDGVLLIDSYGATSDLFKNSGTHGILTLYIRRIPKEYTVTYDANGGSFLCDKDYETSVTVSSGRMTIVRNVMHKNEKYKLLIGSASLSSGTSTGFDIVVETQSDVLLAKSFNFGTNISFEYSAPAGLDKEVTITIICLDVAVFENVELQVTKTVKFGENYDNADGFFPPKRDGYVFEGYYDAATGGNLIDSKTIVKKAANHTIYAHWTKKD